MEVYLITIGYSEAEFFANLTMGLFIIVIAFCVDWLYHYLTK